MNEGAEASVNRAVAVPESRTLVERIVGVFRLPYPLGSLVLAALIGPPGAMLVAYSQTLNLDSALSETVYLFTGNVPSSEGSLATAIIFLLFAYLLYAIRYMRSSVSRNEENFSPLLADGTESYRRAFGPTLRLLPPLVLSFLLVIAVIPSALQGNSIFFTSPVAEVFFFVAFPVAFYIFSTFVWVYFSSIRGLHELGKKTLNLRPYIEDPMLGVRPLGSLSLSFALVYFAGLIILAVDIIVNTSFPLIEGVIMAALICTGVAFFFLPLNTIHQKLVEVRRREMAALRIRFKETRESSEHITPAGPNTSLSDLKETMTQLTNVLIFDVSKSEVNSIPAWPFDTTILSKFAVVLFSVTAIVISRYVAIGLKIG